MLLLPAEIRSNGDCTYRPCCFLAKVKMRKKLVRTNLFPQPVPPVGTPSSHEAGCLGQIPSTLSRNALLPTTIHGTLGRPVGRGAVAAPAGLKKIPALVLQAELQRRAKKASKKLPKLLRQRANLDAQIAELEALAS
jgi:hypothetical protein